MHIVVFFDVSSYLMIYGHFAWLLLMIVIVVISITEIVVCCSIKCNKYKWEWTEL